MRILDKPDREHCPRDPNEVKICAKLKDLTGQDISRLETRNEYNATHFDADGNPEDVGYDYVVSISKKWKNWYIGGIEYGVNLKNDEVEIVELGRWTT